MIPPSRMQHSGDNDIMENGEKLLNDDVLNGTVVMILLTCIISSLATERSARKFALDEKLQFSEKEEESSEMEQILIPVANPETTENLVNLARIYREENERIEMIKADKADPNGDGIVIVPQLRKEFENPYSDAHNVDMTEDRDYWINLYYEIYYDVGNITAIPRDEWEELYADTFGQPK